MFKQTEIIDVATWDLDSEYAVFPQGARAKEAYTSPAEPRYEFIIPKKRYLFKRSRLAYKEQFWAEVIAYRIGSLLGLEVPAALAAWNSNTGICAALIEWFYIDGEEVFVHAGDFLTKTQPDFDRTRGMAHNLRDCSVLLRGFSAAKLLPEGEWKQWWTNALLFDALIGNTDRHQDNWAFLFKPSGDPKKLTARISPLFDNGTSLGHERFAEKFQQWTPENYNRYVLKGNHHVSWALDEPRIKGHFTLLARALQEWPERRDATSSIIKDVTTDALVDVISDLPRLDCSVPLSKERFEFICRLLDLRLKMLRELLL